MTTELRLRNPAQQIYTRALTSAYRSGVQIYDPSVWQVRDPEVEEKMLRDADIAHAVGYRRHLIAGRAWALTPRVDASPRADMAVAIGTELLESIKHFTDARLNLSRAFFSGSRFARIHGVPKVLTIGDGKPRTWWVPVRLEDFDKRMFRIVPNHDPQTQEITAHWERWHIGVDKWIPETGEDALRTVRHVYQDDQATTGHGRALREALGWWWYAKTHVFEESLQAVERFAQGIIHAKVDGVRDAATGKPNTTLISEWTDLLEDLRSRHVLVSSKDDDIEIISGNSEGYQLLSEIRGELKNTIFTLVLGANLTTAANEGGSYALAEVQENSTEALIQYDRETLQETLTDDLLGCVWHKNWPNLVELGIQEDKPRFSITQEKRQDPQERATVAQTLNTMGIDLSLDDLLDQTGFRKPEDGEDLVTGGLGDRFGAGIPGLPLDVSTPVDPRDTIGVRPTPETVEIQDTALNGAQVTAAAELIDRVVRNEMPPGTAVRMLVSMFNLPLSEAQAMVDEADAFQLPAALPTVSDPITTP